MCVLLYFFSFFFVPFLMALFAFVICAEMGRMEKKKRKMTGKKGRQGKEKEKKKERKKSSSAKRCCFAVLADTGVGISYVTWEIAGGECFAGGVAPSAGEKVICSDEFEVDASGESSKCGAVREHAVHIRHVCGIKIRQV